MRISGKGYYFLLASFLASSLNAAATISLPKVIGSNMVLQRNSPDAIWGNAAAGEKVTVKFGKQTKETIADSTGKWMVHLDAMPASFKPEQMIISGSNRIVLDNILVGEVWLCSGQSNMEYTMTKSAKFAHAKNSTGLDSAALKNENNESIRLFLVKRDLTKPDGGGINKGWNAAAGAPLGAFSAAGYYFAKNLYQQLHVPIGMIASSVSGSAIEPWLSGTVKSDSNNLHSIDTTQPGKFYNGMIKPLAPFALKGFLWYQGETNCFLKETANYTYKFKQLIGSWRKLWKNEGASFYFVEIAPFNYSKSKGKLLLDEQSLPEFREAQAAALDLPHAGIVISTDLVDNLEDIHPTYKWEIGNRLALLALARDYKKNLVYSGPVFSKMEINGNNIALHFIHAGKGLMSKDGQPLNWFTIAGVDGNFVPARAVIRGNKVIVSAASVTAPSNVRFAWSEAAQPNLFNKDGLPAMPFRTDAPNKSIANK